MFRRGSVWCIGLLILLAVAGLEQTFSALGSQRWYFASVSDWSAGVFQDTVFQDGNLQLSQSVEIGWQQQRPELNGPARGLSLDPQRNLVISGYSRSSSSNRIHILKCSPDGRVLWERFQSNGPSSRAMGVATDAQGNAYVAGYGLSSSNNYDYQLTKFDVGGNLVWSQTLALHGEDKAQAVAVDANGFVIVTGNSSSSGNDTLTVKLNGQGSVLWQARFDNGGGDWAWGLDVDRFGQIYVAGSSETAGQRDALLLKYNPSGQLLWQRTLNQGGHETATDVEVSAGGNIALTGYSQTNSNTDMFTAVLNTDGQTLWSQQEDFSSKDRAFALAWAQDGSLFVTGGALHAGVEAIHTIKYTPSGHSLWVRAEPTAVAARGYDIETDGLGNVYVIGMEGSGYRTIQYQDGFVQQGFFQSPLFRYDKQVRFTNFAVTAQLRSQSITAVVESSNNDFRTVNDQETFELQPGRVYYSLQGLAPGSSVRVRFVLKSNTPMFSPVIQNFTVIASE